MTTTLEIVLENSTVELTCEQNTAIELGLADIGPTGPQGIQGAIGPTGPQGVQGEVGPTGPNQIGGYPISLVGAPANYDALMFSSGLAAWTNIPQTEIADGGNF